MYFFLNVARRDRLPTAPQLDPRIPKSHSSSHGERTIFPTICRATFFTDVDFEQCVTYQPARLPCDWLEFADMGKHHCDDSESSRSNRISG
jgi:hypothetical protein